jgi:hypothetical protein
VGKHFSADGTHFVFGSSSQFEPDGNNNGDITIYDRDLIAEETHVVSKTPGGATMTGPGIGELAISRDGSRIVIGKLVSEAGGARYWRLYMNVGDSSQTIDLTSGATAGVHFDGMTADGSRVFFSSAEQLTGDDEDASTDIYRADVTETGSTLTRISTAAGSGPGGPGNSDLCAPFANTAHTHWNAADATEDCGAVAVGGGGGVASANGTLYFLSPELLDGGANGVQDAPNLYVARPGADPQFVATLESSYNAPLPAATHPLLRSFGTFVQPGGVAIDHSSGDVYVLDITSGENTGVVQKFDPAGRSVPSFGNKGKITVSGQLRSRSTTRRAAPVVGTSTSLPQRVASSRSTIPLAPASRI